MGWLLQAGLVGCDPMTGGINLISPQTQDAIVSLSVHHISVPPADGYQEELMVAPPTSTDSPMTLNCPTDTVPDLYP